jgi:hypothetical protein
VAVDWATAGTAAAAIIKRQNTAGEYRVFNRMNFLLHADVLERGAAGRGARAMGPVVE